MSVKAGPLAVAAKFLLTLMYGVPIVWILLTSVKSSDDVFDPSRTFLFRPVTTAYVEALSGDLARALLQSVTIATCTTALVLLIAIPAAYGLARTRGLLPTAALGLLIVLQMMPQTATVIPLFQAFSGWRLLDTTAAVVLADAALRYEKNGWGAALNVNNLFDKEYVKGCQTTMVCGYGDGRTITFKLSRTW